MKSLRTVVLVLLIGTTLGGAWLAWRQYGELVELRATALNRDERADLQKRLWELERQNRDLLNRLAAARSADGRSAEATAPGERPGPRDTAESGGRGGPRGRADGGLQQMNALRTVMAKPEVQAMINLQQRAAIEARYATLFKNLNLSSDQAEKLMSLLAERSTTRQDVLNAAREQGVDPRTNPEGLRKLLADTQNEINGTIKSVIGEAGFAQLQNYEQTMPQRSLVNELQQRLSYTNTPLTAAQSEQLVQILAANTPAPSPNPNASGPNPPPGPPPGMGRGPGGDLSFGGRGPDMGAMVMNLVGGGPGPGGGPPPIIDAAMRVAGAPITDGAVAQAQAVLAPPQVSVLQQIQQQQQAQQQLQQIFRETLAPAPPPSATGEGSSTGAGQPTPAPGRRRPGGG